MTPLIIEIEYFDYQIIIDLTLCIFYKIFGE